MAERQHQATGVIDSVVLGMDVVCTLLHDPHDMRRASCATSLFLPPSFARSFNFFFLPAVFLSSPVTYILQYSSFLAHSSRLVQRRLACTGPYDILKNVLLTCPIEQWKVIIGSLQYITTRQGYISY